MVTSKGYAVTVVYTSVLPADSSRRALAVQNNTAGNLLITVGGSTNDNDALVVPAGGVFSTDIPFGGEVQMKAAIAGNVTVVGDNLP